MDVHGWRTRVRVGAYLGRLGCDGHVGIYAQDGTTYKDAFGTHDVAHHLGDVSEELVGGIPVVRDTGQRLGQCNTVQLVQARQHQPDQQRPLDRGENGTHFFLVWGSVT